VRAVLAGSKKERARQRPRGFSLIELLAVVAIVAVLLGVGVPNMQDYIASTRLATTSNDFFTALNVARSEAARRGAQVALAHNGAPNSRNWTSGWSMFVDSNGDGALSAGETVIATGAALDAPLTMFGSTNFANFIAFDSTGRLISGGGSFVICHGTALVAGNQVRSRVVLVNSAGRVRKGLDNNGDLIPETDTGPITNCTNS